MVDTRRPAVAAVILVASLYPLSFLRVDLNLKSIRLSQSSLFALLPSLPFLPHDSQSDRLTLERPPTFLYSYTNDSTLTTNSSFSVPASSQTLVIGSRIYVVSLARRVDRRARLESLLKFMNLQWTWWDATSLQHTVVDEIMERVRWERAMHAINVQWGLVPLSQVVYKLASDEHAGILPRYSHGFKDVDELEAEDPVDWDEDATENLNVYPPLIHSNRSTATAVNDQQASFGRAAPESENKDSTLSPSLTLGGSELWTLDPLTDQRSTQYTNPIPPPPTPDLRLPLPCAPLQLSFDMPAMELSDITPAQLAVISIPREDFEEGTEDVEGHTTHEDHSHDKEQTAKSSGENNWRLDERYDDMDEEDEETLARRHPLAPPSPYPFHSTLSRGMIACWHSHFRLLRHIANGPDEVAIVFEDDIDMEYDLGEILGRLWSGLPANWDIVFLGHCWSPHEDLFAPLPIAPLKGNNSHEDERTSFARLHPSLSPKCTHAYAVSRSGAARIVRHLRSTSSGPSSTGDHSPRSQQPDSDTNADSDPGFAGSERQSASDAHTDRGSDRSSYAAPPVRGLAFAYGRALDQAFVRLIQGRRISSFSVVPSLVIQTKDGPSDITGGNGSAWRDVLRDSALMRLRDAK